MRGVDAATCEVKPPRTWRSVPVVVTTVAVGVLVATMLWSATRSSSAGLVGVDVALAVAALALVPVVLRRPWIGGVLAGLLVALSPVATPVASFAVLFIARNRPFRQAAAVAAVGVAGEAVQAFWRPVPSLPYGWRLVLMTIAYAALLGWGTWAQARNALLAALRDRARRAEQEQERRVDEARAAERNRIAREMHDVLAHRLSLLAAARRRDGVPAGRAARAAQRRRRGDPGQRTPRPRRAARGHQPAAQRRHRVADRRTARADPRRPAAPGRRGAGRRAADRRSTTRSARRSRSPDGRPHRVPDRAGGPDQRPQARRRRSRSGWCSAARPAPA